MQHKISENGEKKEEEARIHLVHSATRGRAADRETNTESQRERVNGDTTNQTDTRPNM